MLKDWSFLSPGLELGERVAQHSLVRWKEMKDTLHRFLTMKDSARNPINGLRQPNMLNIGVDKMIVVWRFLDKDDRGLHSATTRMKCYGVVLFPNLLTKAYLAKPLAAFSKTFVRRSDI